MTICNLDSLFRPTSVALVGASDRAHSVGAAIMHNLVKAGFNGSLWPINLRHRTVGGRRAYRRVSELPSAPDLGVICTPPQTVPGIISELGHSGTRAAVVVTAGLAHQTADDGHSLASAMLGAARPHALRILGPDSAGLLAPVLKLNASFARAQALPGSIAFVSQSGALGTAMLDWAASQGIGVSHFVSLGDSADVDFGDVLDYLATDPGTRAILLYIESITAARQFMSAARAAARNKPVIAVKAGKVSEGARAATSHIGTLARADDIYDAALARAGIVRVDTTQELFDAAETLARARPLPGNRLAIMTNGSGPGMMATDFLVARGGRLAILPEKTLHALDLSLPASWSRNNPVDMGTNAPVERYVAALRALLDNPDCDAVLFIHAPTAVVSSAEIARACVPLIQKSPRSLFACWMGGESVKEADALFSKADVPTYGNPEDAVRGFLQLDRYRRGQELLMETPASIAEDFVPDVSSARTAIEGALSEGRSALSEAEATRVLAAYGIRVVETGSTGLTLQPLVDAVRCHELIVGVASDPVFGPVVLFGAGGVAPETIADTAVALPPLNLLLARELISRTNISRLLNGYGDRPPADRAALQLALVKISQLAIDLPEIGELEINPLLATPSGVMALDARARVMHVSGSDRLVIRPYPSELEESIVVEGRSILLRPIRPEDEPQHREFLARIEPMDMHSRFFYIKREFSHSELARLTQIDYDREMAFIATATSDHGVRETLGVARAIFDPGNTCAEFALLVRSDFQGKGLGRALLSKLIRYCRYRGTKKLVGELLNSNTRMLALCASLGLDAAGTPQDPGVTTVSAVLNPESSDQDPGRAGRRAGREDTAGNGAHAAAGSPIHLGAIAEGPDIR